MSTRQIYEVYDFMEGKLSDLSKDGLISLADLKQFHLDVKSQFVEIIVAIVP